MIRCYVTDRRQGDPLIYAERAVRNGVDLIQVREKDLPASQLVELVGRIQAITKGTATKVLVNDRLDVALACRTEGVHLPEDGLPIDRVRPHIPLIGVSVHSVERAAASEKAGADLLIFGPVFDTPGKRPVGVDALRRVVDAVRIPVLAIGGITAGNTELVLETGAAGIAAIRLFQMD